MEIHNFSYRSGRPVPKLVGNAKWLKNMDRHPSLAPFRSVPGMLGNGSFSTITRKAAREADGHLDVKLDPTATVYGV